MWACADRWFFEDAGKAVERDRQMGDADRLHDNENYRPADVLTSSILFMRLLRLDMKVCDMVFPAAEGNWETESGRQGREAGDGGESPAGNWFRGGQRSLRVGAR
jgi:hypothetical protein